MFLVCALGKVDPILNNGEIPTDEALTKASFLFDRALVIAQTGPMNSRLGEVHIINTAMALFELIPHSKIQENFLETQQVTKLA